MRIVVCTILALLLFCSLPLTATAQTPIAHWKFDDGIITPLTRTASESVNFNNGVWAGDPAAFAWTDQSGGVIGGAGQMLTRGVNGNHFDVAPISQLAGIDQLTISAWINPDTQATGYTGVFTSRDDANQQNWGLAIQGNDPYRIDGRANQVNGYGDEYVINSDDSLPNSVGTDTGGWYHLLQVWDGTADPATNLTFVDGVPARMASEPDIPTDASTLVNPWRIGDDKCCGGREYIGLIDDLAMFDVALDQAQITALYENGLMGIDAAGNEYVELKLGDVNLDDLVDLDDFEIIRGNFYQSVTMRTEGDLTTDGFVNFDDFDQWKTAAGSLGDGVFIPEPGSFLLIVWGCLGFMLSRRRR